MDVEMDEYDRIMHVVRYALHLWPKKLDESGLHASKQEQEQEQEQELYIQETLLNKLTEVHGMLLERSQILHIICFVTPRGGGYDGITRGRMMALDILKDIRLMLEPVIEGSILSTEVEYIARPHDLNDILRLLLSDDSSTISVFPIIGMPNSGKTSLVYSLFHHPLVKHNFVQRIWIHWEHISGVLSAQEILQIVKRTFNTIDCPSDYKAKNRVVVEGLSNEGGKN